MKVFSVIVIVILAALGAHSLPQGSRKDSPRLQPELDSINIQEYLRNDRLLDLQIRCVLDKAPCDTVGRWVKARVAGAVTGQCLMCTEKQKLAMNTIIAHVQEKRPEAFKEIMVKYLKEAGVAA